MLSATPATAPPTTEATARLVRRVRFFGRGVVGLRVVGIGCFRSHLGSNRLRLRFVGFVGNLRLGRDNFRFLGGNFSSHRPRLLNRRYCRLMNLSRRLLGLNGLLAPDRTQTLGCFGNLRLSHNSIGLHLGLLGFVGNLRLRLDSFGFGGFDSFRLASFRFGFLTCGGELLGFDDVLGRSFGYIFGKRFGLGRRLGDWFCGLVFCGLVACHLHGFGLRNIGLHSLGLH